MQVTFLGTGSAIPDGRRAQTGILLDQDDRALLLDCGSGTLQRLAGTDVGVSGVDAVLLTHHHLDHVSDLLPLLKARWLVGETALEIAGPPGTTALLDGLLDVHEYMQDRIDLTVRDIKPPTDTLVGFSFSVMETAHSMPCFAYRFGDEFAFSGDSEAIPDLAAFADGVSVFAHDCSFPDDVDVSNHPTPSQLGAVLEGHAYGTVFLTHLYPHTNRRHDEMRSSLNERYDGDVRFAEDGLSVRC